jgi:hypothetical protein
MSLALCRRPSSYATGQVEGLEDLNPYIYIYIWQQAVVEGVDSNAVQRGEGKNPAYRDLAERGDFHAHFLDLPNRPSCEQQAAQRARVPSSSTPPPVNGRSWVPERSDSRASHGQPIRHFPNFSIELYLPAWFRTRC